MTQQRTLAFNVEAIRQQMLSRVAIPPDILREALEVTRAKLSAKETRFFTRHGAVTETAEIEAHDIQLKAADQIYAIAGVYARERDSKPTVPGTAIEVDTRTGVIRIVTGVQNGTLPVIGEVISVNNTHSLPDLDGAQLSLALSGPSVSDSSPTPTEDPELEFIKLRRGEMPPDVWEKLFGG